MQGITNVLKDLRIFRNIKEEDLPSMLQCLGAYAKEFKRTEFIFMEGEEVDRIGVVLRGSVHMIKEDLWGAKSILAVIPIGGIFGESFACGELDSSTVSFLAATDCQILFLSFRKVLYSCSTSCVFHHKLIENMVALIARKNVQLMETMEIIAKKTIRERILTYLSQEVQRNGTRYITSSMGRLELADYLCTDRSALTRELNKMKEEGILDYDKNTFYLK